MALEKNKKSYPYLICRRSCPLGGFGIGGAALEDYAVPEIDRFILDQALN